MKQMKQKIKRKWRHFKFWVVRRLFPSGELRFLENPMIVDISLKEIMASKAYASKDYDFIGERHIKEVLVNMMIQNLANRLDYEIERQGDYVLCKGVITVAEREVV